MNKAEVKHNYGIDLLRIVAMFMIVAHHFSLHSGITFDAGSANGILMQVMALGGKTGVNIFVLITGYYSSGKIRREKILNLIGNAIFYSIVLTLAATALGSIAFSKKLLVKAALPLVLGKNYWFIVTYLELYLLIPILDKAVRDLDMQAHKKYLVGFTCVLCVIPTIIGRFIEVNNVGYNSLVWFVYLYFLGAYLRKCGVCRNAGKYIYIYILAILAFAQITACVVLQRGLCKGFLRLILECVADYNANAAFPLAIAVAMFLIFENLEIWHGRTIVQMVGLATLGVYLFHDNVNFRGWLWQTVYQLIGKHESWPFAICAVLSVIVVFVLGSTVEILRADAARCLHRLIRRKSLRE